MRGEKRPLFKKEAHEEALHFGVISRDDDDDDEFPHSVSLLNTVFTLSIGTPYLLTILVLKFETVHSTTS